MIGADVCVDAACTGTIRVYNTHLFFFDLDDRVVDPVMLTQTQTMLDWIATRPHAQKHVLTGDFNAFEREPQVDFRCELSFDYRTPKLIRDAGYTDAWLTLHGTTPGMTATLNRSGCGIVNGGPWKRIDYGYVKGLTPTSSTLFGVVPPNTPAPSDHYGLVTGFSGAPDPTSQGTVNVLPAGEVLLRADQNAARLVGRWTSGRDATAAGGRTWTNANQGSQKITTALAEPQNYFELTFTATANTPYHLWLRVRAQGDSYMNDSVFVQFSDSLTSGNAAAYRIGTTSALAVVLENGSGAGLSNWGWSDDGYGTPGTTIKFANTGTHTLRIQQREDGVSIDQILLSPKTFLTAAPGATKNDSTIYTAPQ